jgi:hypothetical protein
MVNEKQIKLIKRSERDERRSVTAEKGRTHIRNSASEAKREVVTVVTGWIRELRQRKAAETTRGFESLFSQSAAGTTRG